MQCSRSLPSQFDGFPLFAAVVWSRFWLRRGWEMCAVKRMARSSPNTMSKNFTLFIKDNLVSSALMLTTLLILCFQFYLLSVFIPHSALQGWWEYIRDVSLCQLGHAHTRCLSCFSRRTFNLVMCHLLFWFYGFPVCSTTVLIIVWTFPSHCLFNIPSLSHRFWILVDMQLLALIGKNNDWFDWLPRLHMSLFKNEWFSSVLED